MRDGKHSSKSKHSQSTSQDKKEKTRKDNKRYKERLNKKSNSNFKKFFLLILIFIILVLIVYFVIQYFYRIDGSKETTFTNEIIYENSVTYELSEDGKSTENIKVKGAEYLEITKFNVIADKNISTVSTKFKNNSDKTYKDVELRITLLDKNNIEITSLDYIIDKIDANGEVLAHGAVKKDLSNCTTCAVALRKK